MSETVPATSTSLNRLNSGGSEGDDGEETDDFKHEPSFHEDNAILTAPQFSKYVEYYNDLKAVMEEPVPSDDVGTKDKDSKKEHSVSSHRNNSNNNSTNNSVANNISLLVSGPTTTTTTSSSRPHSSQLKKKLHKMDDYDPQHNELNITLVVSQMTRDGVDPNDISRFAQALRAQDYYAHMFTSRSRSNSRHSASDDANATPVANEYQYGSNQLLSSIIDGKMSRPTSIPDMKKLIEASSTSLASMDSQSSFEEFFRVNLDERTPSVVMKSVFNFYDDNKDGVLSSKNFKRLLYKMGIRESDLRHFMMLLADKDGNDQINWNDFHTWVKNDQAQRWVRENDRFFYFCNDCKNISEKT